jgi:tetratricopeptide (TPR) repeat protein
VREYSSRLIARVALLALSTVVCFGDTPVAQGSGRESSLLVLPFEAANAFRSPAESLHLELIRTLHRGSNLRVISADSVRRFLSSTPAMEMAEKVGATHLFRCSLKQVGEAVALTFDLRRADGSVLFVGTGELHTADLQNSLWEATGVIRQALGTPVLYAQRAGRSPQAYELHLNACGLQAKRALSLGAKISRLEECVRLWEEALRIDPGFSSAAECLSVAHSDLYSFFHSANVREHHRNRAKLWAEAAASSGHADVGEFGLAYYQYHVERDLVCALLAAEDVARKNPAFPEGLHLLARIYASLGRVRDSITVQRRALVIDPLNAAARNFLIESLSHARDHDGTSAAIAEFASSSEFGPDSAVVAMASYRCSGTLPTNLTRLTPEVSALWTWRQREYARGANLAGRTSEVLCRRSDCLRRLGRSEEAAAAAASALVLAEKVPALGIEPGALARALVRCGRLDDAVGVLRRHLSPQSLATPQAFPFAHEVELAEVYAYLGRPEAIEILRRLLALPSGLTVPMLRQDPSWDALRDNPEFQSLLEDPKNLMPF